MKDFMNKYLDDFIAIVLIFVAAFVINMIVDKILDKTMKVREKKNVTTFIMFIKRVKKVIIYALCVLMALGQIDVFSSFSTTLLSGLGIGSVVLGLAAQESLKNFFGSIAVVIGNAYEVGDFIECVDKHVSGTVEEITMRHTIIRTINNRRVIIPNSEMNTYTIENFNFGDNENVRLVDFPISYEADMDRAMDIIKEELSKLTRPNAKGLNKDAEFPKVRVSSWNDSGLMLRAWVWGRDNSDVFENTYTLNRVVKERFDKEGIEIPYPHVVTLSKEINSKKKSGYKKTA